MDRTRIEELRSRAVPTARHLIDGTSRDASDGGTLDVISPIDGSILTTMPKGTREDAKMAVRSARRAFDYVRWSG
ncbi:MAG: aldehyde dehydrogenase family protein, partial [Ruegeria sp.]|nr:aldehyde dehydrogenase family protein [Ruegeria sp.]